MFEYWVTKSTADNPNCNWDCTDKECPGCSKILGLTSEYPSTDIQSSEMPKQILILDMSHHFKTNFALYIVSTLFPTISDIERGDT
jgi:hypothetical protein